MGRKVSHAPLGVPCLICGLAPLAHRVSHAFEGEGELCTRVPCGLPRSKHREGSKKRGARNRRADGTKRITYIGIDGEGQGRADHKYVLLAASTESGDRVWTVEAPLSKFQNLGEGATYERQLTTVECLDMILSLPITNTKIFSFSFGYDRTKILTDLPDRLLYELERPDLPSRQPTGKNAQFKGTAPIIWVGPNKRTYYLNLQGTKFTVATNYRHPDGSGRMVMKTVVVWDLFKFFQGKFVTAIDNWNVGTEEDRAFIKLMKERRDEFDKEPPERVKQYCLRECRYIGEIGHKLVDAHDMGEIPLKSFHGAGSSGAAMLDAMKVREKLAPVPEEMKEAVATAFGGGRFENSVIGSFREPLNNWDISSAYVYQLYMLPCLKHASWKHTKSRKDLEKAQAQNGALVRYTLGKMPKFCRNLAGKEQSPEAWGPFPFRLEDGCISYPIESGGGWVWLDEYLIGEKLFPHVQFREAWVYESNCACRPFEKIPEYYLLRLKVGKEGRGIAIKLAMNSCYGKLAQSLGAALFNNWIWAGMVTSGTRAQLLTMLGMHDDFWNMLMLATDGVVTREHLTPPVPLPTKTDMPYMKKGKLVSTPLGGWEHKDAPRGMFIARPGIYFPLEPTQEEIDAIRARGVGRSVVLKHWPKLVETWERDGVTGKAVMPNVTRFCGIKTSISVSQKGTVYKRARGAEDENSYGQWVERKVEMGFNPLPKRERVRADGRTLELRRFPATLRSVPYERAMREKDENGRWIVRKAERVSTDTLMMRLAEIEASEQPDISLEEYELGMTD